jgi:PAS domain S-box-containing protein
MQNQQEENYNFSPSSDHKEINLSYKVTPSDRELEWDKSKVLMSKTDIKGNILYANEAFIDVCGYDDFELMDKPHSILRHPDMPRVIFKLLWENLQGENSFHVIIKNMSKTGRYYWVSNDVKTVKDANGNITYTGQQQHISNDIVAKHIEPLYRKLLQIENASGVQSSENYLLGFLEEKRKSFIQFTDELVFNINQEPEVKYSDIPKKKGFFTGMFSDKDKKK